MQHSILQVGQYARAGQGHGGLVVLDDGGLLVGLCLGQTAHQTACGRTDEV